MFEWICQLTCVITISRCIRSGEHSVPPLPSITWLRANTCQDHQPMVLRWISSINFSRDLLSHNIALSLEDFAKFCSFRFHYNYMAPVKTGVRLFSLFSLMANIFSLFSFFLSCRGRGGGIVDFLILFSWSLILFIVHYVLCWILFS